jgi:hypothetical protein
MYKAVLIGLGGGLALGGFWTLQDVYPFGAKVLVAIVGIPLIAWSAKGK